MISQLTVECVVFSPPELKVTPAGVEYLSMVTGLFDVKEAGAQEFTKLDCTLWGNPNLARRIMEMDLGSRDRVLVSGKFSTKKIYGKYKFRLYIHELSLLSRSNTSTKNTDYSIDDMDYTALDGVEVFDTEAKQPIKYQAVRDEQDDLKNNEDF